MSRDDHLDYKWFLHAADTSTEHKTEGEFTMRLTMHDERSEQAQTLNDNLLNTRVDILYAAASQQYHRPEHKAIGGEISLAECHLVSAGSITLDRK